MKFEQSLKRIDEIIAAPEKDDVSLEDSLKYYKEGTKLISNCRSELKKAELLVTVNNEEIE